MASCGQTYVLQSITVAPKTFNLEGLDTVQALTVTAHYSNTKTEDVTVKSTFQVGQATALTNPNTPNGAVSVSLSGTVQTSPTVYACTWLTTSTANGYTYSETSPYVVTASYAGFQDTAAVYVASLSSCYDGTGHLHP